MKSLSENDNTTVRGSLTISTFRDGKLIQKSPAYPNKVVTSSGYGRNLIARALAGDSTYSVVIDSAALGDDDTAAADGNTGLGNSLVSGSPISNMSTSSNILNVDVFVADDNLPDDTYEEFGLFCDGRLFARVVISPAYTKVSGEDTLFSYTLTLTG
jgi:hypothetical protein